MYEHEVKGQLIINKTLAPIFKEISLLENKKNIAIKLLWNVHVTLCYKCV